MGNVAWRHYPADPPTTPGKYMILTNTTPDEPFTMDFDYVPSANYEDSDRMAFGSYENHFDPGTLGFIDSEFNEANFESEIFAWCERPLPDEKFMDETFANEDDGE